MRYLNPHVGKQSVRKEMHTFIKYVSTYLRSSNIFLYTLLAPNKNTSESSVTMPSTRFDCSINAHCASASMGAMMYGMPKIWSSSYGKPRSTKHYKFVVKSNTNRNFGKFAKGLYKEDNDSYV